MKKMVSALLLSAFLLSGCGAKGSDNTPAPSVGANQPSESISNPEQAEEPTPPEEPKLPEEPNQAEAEPAYIPTDVTNAEEEPAEEPAGEVLSGETSQSLSERIAAEISSTEAREKEVEKRQEEAETQGDMNVAAKEMYQLWDDTLNTIWGFLEESLDKTDMDALRKEESEWIASKEAEVQAVGEETGGGSLQPLVEAMKAAEMTKARVYELAKYAEGK